MNCSPLFDESGGSGCQVRAWSGLPDWYVGYAGGIGPDDVTESVTEIMTYRSKPFWIDMEGRVRDERDQLDMKKVERVLELCDNIMTGPAFSGLMASAERKRAEK